MSLERDAFLTGCSEILYKCIFLLVLHDDCPNGTYLCNVRNRHKSNDAVDEYVLPLNLFAIDY